MKQKVLKALEKKYAVLFFVLAALFVYILLNSDMDAKLFANIIGTLVLLAIIPFAILYLMKKENKK